MSSVEIPADVWASISSHIIHPKGHIVLSQVSQTSRTAYFSEERWKLLCRSIGIGMGMQEKRTMTWKRALIEVIAHRAGCRMPQCYMYGAPPMSVVGDLLPDAEAVQQHCEYFRLRDLAKPKPPCTCGGHHHDDPVPPLEDIEEDDNDGEDGDEDEDDDGEDGEDDDWESDGDDPAPPPPQAPDPSIMMANLLNMMGMGPPPAPNDQYNPLAGLFPAGPGGIPFPPPGPFTAPLAGQPAGPSAGPAKPASDQPAPPPIKPHLLPLSWKNREHVPAHPKLHPFLVECGAIQFQRFIKGETCLNPFALDPTVGSKVPVGIDWEVQDEEEDWKERNIMRLKDHPLLARAFATNPPTAELNFDVDGIRFKVINRDGVTIKDVIHNMDRVLAKPISAADKKILCGAEYPHSCHLDEFSNRLDFVLRDPSGHGYPDLDDGVIREVWFRGTSAVVAGEVTVAMFP